MIILTYTLSFVIYHLLCYQPLRPPVYPLHWCIDWAEGHDCIFEEPVSASECGFPFVPLFDPDEVVAVLEVNFVEPLGSSNAFLELIHVGEGVTVWNRYFVDSSVVNA